MTSIYCGEFFPQHFVGWWPCTILLRWWEFESSLSSWHGYRLKKNTWLGRTCSESEVTQCAGSKIVPRSWTCSLSPAPHSHPCAEVHCTWVSFHANSLGDHSVSQTIVMIWVKNNPSLTNSTTKASRLCICTMRHICSFDTVLCTDRAENCVRCHFLRL